MSDKTAAGVAKIRHIETLAPEELRSLEFQTEIVVRRSPIHHVFPGFP